MYFAVQNRKSTVKAETHWLRKDKTVGYKEQILKRHSPTDTRDAACILFKAQPRLSGVNIETRPSSEENPIWPKFGDFSRTFDTRGPDWNDVYGPERDSCLFV